MKHIIFSILFMAAVAAMGQNKCKATTAKGQPCRAWADSTGWCHAHNPGAIRCAGTTAAGKPCRVIVGRKGDLCRWHKTAAQ